MNTVNIEKRLMSKKSQTIKTMTIALAISLASIFSFNASAITTPSIEVAISDFVVAQGQQMIKQLNDQLQQSIANEVKEFSFTLSVADIEQQVSKTIVREVAPNELTKGNIIAHVN